MDEHAAFMDALVEEGFVILGGPIGAGERVLVVVEAEDEREIERRLEPDPWKRMRLLHTASVEPWDIRLDGRVASRWRERWPCAHPGAEAC